MCGGFESQADGGGGGDGGNADDGGERLAAPDVVGPSYWNRPPQSADTVDLFLGAFTFVMLRDAARVVMAPYFHRDRVDGGHKKRFESSTYYGHRALLMNCDGEFHEVDVWGRCCTRRLPPDDPVDAQRLRAAFVCFTQTRVWNARANESTTNF